MRRTPGEGGSIVRESHGFRAGKQLADMQHHVAGIIAPLARTPLVELFGEVGCGLRAQRRIGGADAFTIAAVTGRAGCQPPRGVTLMV